MCGKIRELVFFYDQIDWGCDGRQAMRLLVVEAAQQSHSIWAARRKFKPPSFVRSFGCCCGVVNKFHSLSQGQPQQEDGGGGALPACLDSIRSASSDGALSDSSSLCILIASALRTNAGCMYIPPSATLNGA